MNSRSLELLPIAPLGCNRCAFLNVCGGLEQQSLFGCFIACGSCRGMDGCDYVCPSKPSFWRAWAEIGGLAPTPRRPVPPVELALPFYVPMVRHGHRRSEALPADVVALNTFDVVGATCRVSSASAAELRDRYRLQPDARVVLISVNDDTFVESFWAHRTPERLRSLAECGIAAMSTPNFSIFDDAPRLHSVRNLWRILRAAEEIADAGIAPILHLNATVAGDWRFWRGVLTANPGVRHVCKEFQTGLQDPGRAAEAIDGLRRLQDDVGRPLHPVVVGGRRVAADIARWFASFTIIDSVPFFATVMRKRITMSGPTVAQIDNPTAPGEMLDDLLQDNVRAYAKVVSACARRRIVDPVGLDAFERVVA